MPAGRTSSTAPATAPFDHGIAGVRGLRSAWGVRGAENRQPGATRRGGRSGVGHVYVVGRVPGDDPRRHGGLHRRPPVESVAQPPYRGITVGDDAAQSPVPVRGGIGDRPRPSSGPPRRAERPAPHRRRASFLQMDDDRCTEHSSHRSFRFPLGARRSSRVVHGSPGRRPSAGRFSGAPRGHRDRGAGSAPWRGSGRRRGRRGTGRAPGRLSRTQAGRAVPPGAGDGGDRRGRRPRDQRRGGAHDGRHRGRAGRCRGP